MNSLFLVELQSPLGNITAVSSPKGICYLMFSDFKDLQKDLKNLETLHQTVIKHHTNVHLLELDKQLKDYFKKELTQFTIPLDFHASCFQQKVWEALLEIPYSKVISYKQQATCLGTPLAFRAVASCNARNRIMILIPCHRVIGSNGKLSGYAGGVGRKKYLIDLESQSYRFDL